MLFKERILCKGHPNILGTHKTTLEITKDKDLTLNGNCILGIGIESPNVLLSPRLQTLLKHHREVTIQLECEGIKDSFTGWGHPSLLLTHPHDMVFRKSEYIDDRTILIKCNKAVNEINRNLISKMKNPQSILSLTFEIYDDTKEEVRILSTHPKHTSNILNILQKHDLLSRKYRIIHTPEKNVIPLVKALDSQILEEIQQLIKEPVSCSLMVLEDKYPMDRMNLEEALKNEIPDEFLSLLPRSFDILGDVCIIELLGHEKDPLIEFRYIIARRLLSILPSLTAIYMKRGNVSGIYRTRELEFLDGIDKEETTIVENNCRFRLKFKTTFFTPRLIRERKILSEFDPVKIGLISKIPYLSFDMFTGIGPFAIQIAKKQKNTKIIACDINPDAIKYAKINAEINKVSQTIEFIESDIRNVDLSKYGPIQRVIMNLPEKNFEYLDIVATLAQNNPILLHIYFFAPKNDLEAKAKELIESNLRKHHLSIMQILRIESVKPFNPALDTVAADLMIAYSTEEIKSKAIS